MARVRVGEGDVADLFRPGGSADLLTRNPNPYGKSRFNLESGLAFADKVNSSPVVNRVAHAVGEKYDAAKSWLAHQGNQPNYAALNTPVSAADQRSDLYKQAAAQLAMSRSGPGTPQQAPNLISRDQTLPVRLGGGPAQGGSLDISDQNIANMRLGRDNSIASGGEQTAGYIPPNWDPAHPGLNSRIPMAGQAPLPPPAETPTQGSTGLLPAHLDTSRTYLDEDAIKRYRELRKELANAKSPAQAQLIAQEMQHQQNLIMGITDKVGGEPVAASGPQAPPPPPVWSPSYGATPQQSSPAPQGTQEGGGFTPELRARQLEIHGLIDQLYNKKGPLTAQDNEQADSLRQELDLLNQQQAGQEAPSQKQAESSAPAPVTAESPHAELEKHIEETGSSFPTPLGEAKMAPISGDEFAVTHPQTGAVGIYKVGPDGRPVLQSVTPKAEYKPAKQAPDYSHLETEEDVLAAAAEADTPAERAAILKAAHNVPVYGDSIEDIANGSPKARHAFQERIMKEMGLGKQAKAAAAETEAQKGLRDAQADEHKARAEYYRNEKAGEGQRKADEIKGRREKEAERMSFDREKFQEKKLVDEARTKIGLDRLDLTVKSALDKAEQFKKKWDENAYDRQHRIGKYAPHAGINVTVNNGLNAARVVLGTLHDNLTDIGDKRKKVSAELANAGVSQEDLDGSAPLPNPHTEASKSANEAIGTDGRPTMPEHKGRRNKVQSAEDARADKAAEDDIHTWDRTYGEAKKRQEAKNDAILKARALKKMDKELEDIQSKVQKQIDDIVGDVKSSVAPKHHGKPKHKGK